MTQWGIDTLFNPSKRHMDEEKQRLQSTREEVGDSSGGKRIDLESGKVVISRADDDADAEASNGDAPTGDAATDAAVQSSATEVEESKPPESAARLRARERRARQRH